MCLKLVLRATCKAVRKLEFHDCVIVWFFFCNVGLQWETKVLRINAVSEELKHSIQKDYSVPIGEPSTMPFHEAWFHFFETLLKSLPNTEKLIVNENNVKD